MKTRLKMLQQIAQNMGWRYVKYRAGFELRKRTGFLKKDFPTETKPQHWISLKDWKNQKVKFFFESREQLQFEQNPSAALKEKVDNYKRGVLRFFSATDFELGKNYDWLTNPDSGYRYELKHWTEIPDYSSQTGDIKYVWEKSRFSFLYDLIRYDYHFGEDQSQFIFDEIISWIDANPVNRGPNWRCSQEISLRVLNWTFALNYYKNSETLTEETFQKIIGSIYWQMRHVYANIDFSRIAVRNNHAITETLTLYLMGLLMPFFPESKRWKSKGKQWFEEEIAYQIYEDGTFLQFSMNYHRVVIQLLTWAFYLAEKTGEKFKEVVYERAKKSLDFLMVCQDETSGQLPNYGANDGALFFPLNDADYRDYRPQLNVLHYFFDKTNYTVGQEDIHWFGGDNHSVVAKTFRGAFKFDKGGYYIFKEDDSLSFIRCGSHKDRPSQADNLHLDVWVKGINVLRDAGSYKYNTDADSLRYFLGTRSHNTLMIADNDQMLKGPRFIWFNWSQAVSAEIVEAQEYFEFEGKIRAFEHVAKGTIHTRKFRKYKNDLHWHIIDSHTINRAVKIRQIWNTALHLPFEIMFENTNAQKSESKGYFSGYYGQKEESRAITFETEKLKIETHIKIS
jgi:hypothetical protein